MKRGSVRYWMLDVGRWTLDNGLEKFSAPRLMGKWIVACRIRSFTIFESVISTTIISVLIGIAAMIYTNVIGSEKPLGVYQAEGTIVSMLQDLKVNKSFFSKSVEQENCVIRQEVNFYHGNKNIYEVIYKVDVGTKTWHTEKHLVRTE